MFRGFYDNEINKKIIRQMVRYVFIVFKSYLWVAIFLVSTATAILLKLLKRTENIVKANFSWYFLITFSLKISNYVQLWSKKISFQIFAMGFALYGIVISSAYKSTSLKILKQRTMCK